MKPLRCLVAMTAALLLVGCGGAPPPSAQSAAVSDEPTGPVMSGEELYRHWCADCHDAGPGHPGTLRMAGDFGEAQSVLLEMQGLSRELVKVAVRNGFQMMPPFRHTEISDEELERLAGFMVKQ